MGCWIRLTDSMSMWEIFSFGSDNDDSAAPGYSWYSLPEYYTK